MLCCALNTTLYSHINFILFHIISYYQYLLYYPYGSLLNKVDGFQHLFQHIFNLCFAQVRPRPTAEWLSDVSWARLSELEDLGKAPWPGCLSKKERRQKDNPKIPKIFQNISKYCMIQGHARSESDVNTICVKTLATCCKEVSQRSLHRTSLAGKPSLTPTIQFMWLSSI